MNKLLLAAACLLGLLALTGCKSAGDAVIMAAAEQDGSANRSADFSSEPPLDIPKEKLDAGLRCTDFTHPDKPPVLLVHGTFTAGPEQYEWNYIPLLMQKGFDVCTVTYPDRGLGDQQESAEYIVNALRSIHAQSGRKVAMIGHSQGASMPRWALKFWPSARNAVEDFVLQAGPNHGLALSAQSGQLSTLLTALGLNNLPIGLLPATFFQFSPNSNFTKVVNMGDETPGDVDYTTLYTQFDELVQPYAPVPTAALDWQQNNPHVSNTLLQDVCPGYIVDHVTIGTTDALAFALTLDAISNPGPASVERAGGAAKLCALPVLPQENIGSYTLPGFLDVLPTEGVNSIPNPHLVTAEPALKPYAQAVLDGQ